MDINGSIVLDRSGSLLNQLMTVGGPHCKGTCRRTTRISEWLFDELTKLVQLDHDWPIKDWDLTRLTIKYCITITYLLLNLLSYKWHHKHVGFDPRIGLKKLHRSTSVFVTSTKPYQAYREFHQACECAIYVGQQNSDIQPIYIYI